MKHDSAHKLNFACLDCVRVHLEHNRILVNFVTRVANNTFCACKDLGTSNCITCRAWEILKEIEKDNE